MKLEIIKKNVVLVSSSNENFEIHPLWLRERAKTEELVDKYNDQRLFDPSQLDQKLKNFKNITVPSITCYNPANEMLNDDDGGGGEW